jgi:hypothetical protein
MHSRTAQISATLDKLLPGVQVPFIGEQVCHSRDLEGEMTNRGVVTCSGTGDIGTDLDVDANLGPM